MRHPVLAAGSVLGLILGAAPSVKADQIVLADGQILEGNAVERGAKVEVKMDIGSITLDRRDIQEIKKSDTALDELEKRRQAVKGDNPAELHKLAAWALDHGLDSKARDIYRRIVEIAPNDKRAHEALGEHLLDGRWLDDDDYMRAKGLVFYQGRWRTADEARLLADEDKRLESARAERERSEMDLQKRRADEDAAALRAQQEQGYLSSTYWSWPWVYGWPWGRGLWGYGPRFRSSLGPGAIAHANPAFHVVRPSLPSGFSGARSVGGRSSSAHTSGGRR
jgi:hypothetical protein